MIIGFAATIFASSGARAVVIGGSNLPLFGYPDHQCTKPYDKPVKPYEFHDQDEINLYNSEVDEYNSQLERFTACIREYLENANNDIKRIQEKAQDAVDEANSL
ncbi:MAG TPA: hypothetical protein VGT78_14760 [Rhizomicrobium sp.]|nr:hypothetical protein [Rhizomicrobium sp.]